MASSETDSSSSSEEKEEENYVFLENAVGKNFLWNKEKEMMECIYCNAFISYKRGTNGDASNCNRHLKSQHKLMQKHAELSKKKTNPFGISSMQANKREKGDAADDIHCNRLYKWLFECDFPFATVSSR